MNLVEQTHSNPNVSIIIPLYNKGKYVARALNSILAQTYQNFEVFVVDDGSTDNGPEIVNSYTDSRLRLIRQTNAGPGAARNRGIQSSQAPLLAFLDADDEWMPTFLAESVQQLQAHPDCAISAFGRFLGAERTSWEPGCRQFGVTEGEWRMPVSLDAHSIKRVIDFFHPGAIVCRREVLDRFGGFYTKNGCNYGEDVYLWAQIALNYKIYRNPVPLFWWHTEASEISAYSARKIVPPWPMLTDPQPLRMDCPPAYQPALERYLTYLAVIAAERCIRAGDRATAERLLQDYPVAQTFLGDYLKLQLRLWLMDSPRLRQRLRQVKSLVRS
uniref:glycosyltransferase family 2 protein n=1 Tax=Trichocoleus desertorum TaxID=1481672 RepID=UPI0025B54D6E|nr:glycosyltransferase family A protein [Trichocoleus desertorum]